MAKVYVAGPMRGYPEYNFPAFDAAATMLRGMGWEVTSPAEHDREVGFDVNTPEDQIAKFVNKMMRWDIRQLLKVQAVYMLADWEASTGATTEHSIAATIGLLMMYEKPRDEEKYLYLGHTAFKRPETFQEIV